ncbi:MAG TPA: metallophosphoesterase, partial [bacterium]|nr:metallophosphoesterase [bacterium]
MKRKRIVQLAVSVLFLALAGLFGIMIDFHRDYSNIPRNHLIGNRPLSLAALEERGFPFSFLVIGDTQTNETAETLIETALKGGNTSFMVILGDFVKKPDLWSHRFFLTEMTAEIKPPFPVFLVAGNHDIDHFLSPKESAERRVTPE